jgi:hypothetical protein
VRWSDATAQAGRHREAAEALDEALAALEARGDRRAVATALQLRSRVSLVGGEGQHVALAEEAARLLEQDGPSPELVAAYAQVANATAIAGKAADAIAAADKAVALSAELGLPRPARAIAYRGYARVYLGDRGGLDDMEWARERLSAAGAGRDAATAHNNLGIARYQFEGPEKSLATFADGIAFSQERGLIELVVLLGAYIPGLLIELGRVDEALERARTLTAQYDLLRTVHLGGVEVRAAELLARALRGETALRSRAEELLVLGKAMANADLAPYTLTSVATALVVDAPGRVEAVLADLEGIEGASGSPYFARFLPQMVRTALAVGQRNQAERLLGSLTTKYPLTEHSLCAARAALGEDARDPVAAASLYAEAASRWAEFGNVPERAFALLGHGRCARAAESLREARELFASMGFAPALAEVDALLATVETVV